MLGTFLSAVLSLAVGWTAFGAVYFAISEIRVARTRADLWKYMLYGQATPIVHHERKKQMKGERENERLDNSDN